VVGTVIDPEMSEELRVTVVATGLGGEIIETPLKVVESKPIISTANPDYRALDRPTIMRTNPQSALATDAIPASPQDKDMEYLDIPAFLRRQAD
jgi:cell division protein FtsZ